MPYFSANMHQIQFRLGLCPRPRWRRLQRSPDSLAGGEEADCPSPKTSPLHLASPGPLGLNMRPFGPFLQTLPHQHLNLKVIVKLCLLARLSITCKWEKSRDCATCDIGLYAEPDAQFQLDTLLDGNVIPSIILITRSVLFSLKCTRKTVLRWSRYFVSYLH